MGDIDFKFTIEQEIKFNLILKETKKIYPHLCEDEINLYRTKILIAHTVIFGDDKLNITEKNKENEFIEVK